MARLLRGAGWICWREWRWRNWGCREGLQKCKGRPRKPLAEVILKCAPLRATSSGNENSILFAICK